MTDEPSIIPLPSWFMTFVCRYLVNIRVECPQDDVSVDRFYGEIDLPDTVRQALIQQLPNRTSDERVLPSALYYLRQDHVTQQQQAYVVLVVIGQVMYCNRQEMYLNLFYFRLETAGTPIPLHPFECAPLAFQDSWTVVETIAMTDKPLIVYDTPVALIRTQSFLELPRADIFQSSSSWMVSTGITLDGINLPTNYYTIVGVSTSIRRWASTIWRT